MADASSKLEKLIQDCKSGDRLAQKRVYEQFYGKMMAVCLRYAKDYDLAQDLLQDGFIKVFTSIARYDGKGSFEGWIRRIVVNTAIDHFRKQKNDWVLLREDQELEDLGQSYDPEEDSEDMGYGFKPKDILEAMQKLTPAYRTIFNLYIFENLSHREIADSLGISEGTSKSNLAKAKRNLRKILLKDFNRADG